MRKSVRLVTAGRLAAAATVGAATLMFAAPSAFADTSASTANAVTLTLIPINSGTESASNPGSPAVVTETASPPLSILGTQSAITVGGLQQTAVATSAGTSSGCAGLVGKGAEIQVGSTNICSLVTSGETGGITIGGGLGVGVVAANAIVETCGASATAPTTTASAELADVTALAGLVKLPVNPKPNTKVLGLIDLNVQTSTGPGEITATALEIPAIGLKVGTVTCGPNAITGVSSAFPLKSLPIVAGTAAVLGAIGVVWYRRRQRYERV